jgi:hypothetical protein
MKSARTGCGTPERRHSGVRDINGRWPDIFPTFMGDILLRQKV